MSWGKCSACGKAGDIYPASKHDEATHHFKAGWFCRTCLKWESPDLPPRNHLTFDDSPKDAA